MARRDLGRRLEAGLAGVVAGSLAEALLRPAAGGLAALDLGFLAALAGNLPVGLALAWALPAGTGPGRRAARAAAAGAAAGGGALAGAWLVRFHGIPGGPRAAILLATAAVLLLLRLPRRLPEPPPRACRVLAALAALAATALLLGAGAADPAAEGARPRPLPPPAAAGVAGGPNVLLVSIDSLRAADARRPGLELRALARLRSRGLSAPFARSPAPAAIPGHFAMLTGTSPADPAFWPEGRFTPPDDVPSLAGILRSHGWRTVAVLWNSLPGAAASLSRGFDLYHNPARRGERLDAVPGLARGTWLGALLPGRAASRVLLWLAGRRIRGLEGDPRRLLLGHSPARTSAELARAYLAELEDGARPWFLFLHFADLHQPYLPDAEVRGLQTGGAGLPPPYAGRTPDSPGLSGAIQADLQAGRRGAAEAARILHLTYLEELLFVDRRLEEVLAAVAASRRPTVVLVTSDHGEQFGEHARMGHGNSLYEPVLRVPFLLAAPELARGELQGVPVLEDVAPTLLGLCGIEPPPWMSGRDLLRPPGEQQPWLAMREGEVAVYEGRRKLLCRVRGLGSREPALEPLSLFDLVADPGEERDLLPAAAAEAAAMRDRALGLLRARAAVRPGVGEDPGHAGGG